MVTVFPSLSAVGSWEEVLLFSIDFAVSRNFFEFVLCKFLFEKASLSFPNCLCILVPNFPEKLHIAGAIRCKYSTPQDVFVLVKGSQGWSEPRAVSVPGSKFFEWGMLI